ncbi:MAG: hypothetical protein K2Y02_04355 [Burkholderiaceae bacterium]|nr:hypothetical protein [Burkholderiaceae bacterium]
MGARELLSDLAGAGLSVIAQGDRLVIQPASKLTDPMRAALRDAKPDLLALLRGVAGATEGRTLPAIGWTDADIARFLDRRARLMRWGWAESEAETLADRLVRRDREQDERVSCTDCRHYRPGRCGNHRRAGLNVADVGRDLASLLQRCPGWEARAGPGGGSKVDGSGPLDRPDPNYFAQPLEKT